jgi:hypothetical protein
MINALVIATATALTATPAQSQDKLTPQDILAIAKMAGACGILDSMIQFQNTTRMAGGNEFVTRFWAVEAARLGMSVEQLSDRCTRSINAYDRMWNAPTR